MCIYTDYIDFLHQTADPATEPCTFYKAAAKSEVRKTAAAAAFSRCVVTNMKESNPTLIAVEINNRTRDCNSNRQGRFP